MPVESSSILVSKTMRANAAETCAIPVANSAFFVSVDFSGMSMLADAQEEAEDIVDAADAAVVESRRGDPQSDLGDVLKRLNARKK